MQYQKIHDRIISRALIRTCEQNLYYEMHHILPKCEGGLIDGQTVLLTLKEHRIIHLLRFKITGVSGNFSAYHLMRNTETSRRLSASLAAKKSHSKFKDRDPIGYIKRQSESGKRGGNASRSKRSGFHSLSEIELTKARNKGRQTIVENKLGMFAPEFKEKLKQLLHKKIITPDRTFDSMGEAAKFYNVVNGTITYRVNSPNFKDWKFA